MRTRIVRKGIGSSLLVSCLCGYLLHTCAYIYTLAHVDYELTDEERRRFEELCEQKIKIVEERNDVVMQAEDERIRCALHHHSNSSVIVITSYYTIDYII